MHAWSHPWHLFQCEIPRNSNARHGKRHPSGLNANGTWFTTTERLEGICRGVVENFPRHRRTRLGRYFFVRISSMTIVFSGEQNAIVTMRSKNSWRFNRRKLELGMARETLNDANFIDATCCQKFSRMRRYRERGWCWISLMLIGIIPVVATLSAIAGWSNPGGFRCEWLCYWIRWAKPSCVNVAFKERKTNNAYIYCYTLLTSIVWADCWSSGCRENDDSA